MTDQYSSMNSNNFSYQIDQNLSSDNYPWHNKNEGTWTVKDQRIQECDITSKYSQQPDRQNYNQHLKIDKTNKTNLKQKKPPKNSEIIHKEFLKNKNSENWQQNWEQKDYDHFPS